ncbi:MAG: ACP S-malonyltransferase [Pseudomonadota bacterium]
MRAFIFPGQGSQFLGMGQDLAATYTEAKSVFQEVDDALSQNLSALMMSGEEATLNLTENTQPALMAVSMAVVRVLEKQGGFTLAEKASFVAGHSLGEYTALTAARSFPLADAARLLKKRGQAMQAAVPVGVGAMAAILGLDMDAVQAIVAQAAIAAKGECIAAANDNSTGQVVISGHRNAVTLAIALATAAGAKRAIELPVSAPFHCDLMLPAARVMADALMQTAIQAPALPLIANVTADVVTDPDMIRDLLVQQVTGTVRWRESVQTMVDKGVDTFIELGAGKVLNGLVKRGAPDATLYSVGTPAQIDDILTVLTQ